MDFEEIVKWSEQKRKDQQDDRGTFEKILSFSVVAFVIIICAVPLFFSEIQRMRYEVKSMKKSGRELKETARDVKDSKELKDLRESKVKNLSNSTEEVKMLPSKQKVLRIKKKQPLNQHEQENEKTETKEEKQEEEVIYIDDETGNPIDPSQIDDYEIIEENEK
jgi:hypothetical protein